MNHEKVIVALEDPSLDAGARFAAWAREVAAGTVIGRAELELLDADVQAAHTAAKVRFHGFASFWVDAGHLAPLVAARPGGTTWLRVRERLAFDRSARDDEARPWSGVKKTTPWTSVDGVAAEVWQGRYTNHGWLAAAHHATCVRYRQNVVLDGSDPSLHAVSELWYTDPEDIVERFYRSDEARRLVAIDTLGFVDASRAHPTVTRQEVLRIAGAVTPATAFV